MDEKIAVEHPDTLWVTIRRRVVLSMSTMRVALFDLHTNGYHLEMGSKLYRSMDRFDDVKVDFVVPELTDELRTRYPDDNLVALPGFATDATNPEASSYRRKAIDAAMTFFDGATYDIVQLMEIDDILEYVYHHAKDRPGLPPLIGRLDGGRFFRNTRRHQITTAFTGNAVGSTALRYAHRRFFGTAADSSATKRRAFRLVEPALGLAPARYSLGADEFDQFLFSLIKPAVLENSLQEGIYEHVVVQTPGAAAYLDELAPAYTADNLSVVPDPVDIWFDDLPTPADARDRLGIDADGPVLLTFGELRREKGIDLLLDALERYEGSTFTMVIVGKPVDVSEAELRAASSRTDVPLHAVLEFVPDADVPLYFAAANGVVVPYRRTFGYERTSGPFQKACASCRPVLAPRFGMFEKRVLEWNLGMLFDPGDASELARQLRVFAADPARTFDPDSTKRYAQSQSYDTLASELRDVYRTRTKPTITSV